MGRGPRARGADRSSGARPAQCGAALERLARIRTVIFEKTGTLIPGRPRLVGNEADPALGRDAALRLAAALAQASTHPVSVALLSAARARGFDLPMPESVPETPAGGLSGPWRARR
ncbi:MAG: HAD family hydrolase [Alphaproteobacteria bacterium]|nr:HAD family hydrolase [Alphaproteobacteria bacterium]